MATGYRHAPRWGAGKPPNYETYITFFTAAITCCSCGVARTEEATSHGAEVVIWPESTVPLSYASTDFYRQAIESVSRDRNIDVDGTSAGSERTEPKLPR